MQHLLVRKRAKVRMCLFYCSFLTAADSYASFALFPFTNSLQVCVCDYVCVYIYLGERRPSVVRVLCFMSIGYFELIHKLNAIN